MRKIIVCDYNPEWDSIYQKEKSILIATIGDVIQKIHHIGSTSVKGLSSKPIIDILIETDNLNSLDSSNHLFEKIGYEVMGEFGISGRRFFRKGGDDRTHHIHAFKINDENVIRHLAFRDYLRNNPDVAGEYSKIKLEAVSFCNNDIQKYCDYKDAFIKKYEKIAMDV